MKETVTLGQILAVMTVGAPGSSGNVRPSAGRPAAYVHVLVVCPGCTPSAPCTSAHKLASNW